jgi:DNA polymerase (family 10)
MAEAKKWTNGEIAALLMRIANILEIQGEIVFKVNAYRRAADAIDHLPRDIRDIWQNDADNLREIQGVGEALAEKLDELLRTGKMSYYEKISKGIPAGVLDMLTIPDVGPKTAARLWKELKITNLAQLEQAARAGKLSALKGFGKRSEEKILAGIEAVRRKGAGEKRILLGSAYPFAHEIVNALAERCGKAILDISPAGSLRRMKATIGDLDILVSSNEPARILDAFVSLPQVAAVSEKGTTKASIVADNGMQVDVRVLEPRSWGTALQYFTGSKEHNVTLRQIALEQGLSLSEWNFKPVLSAAEGTVKGGKEIYAAREEEVYERLGLSWIPPELREAAGEIEAAQNHTLPALIEYDDLKGDLQTHSTWSDGSFSIAAMAEAAQARGLKYLAVTDHTQGLGIARGLSPERLREQWREIDALNEKYAGKFTILKSVEVEIRADGSLDLPDEVLAQLDICCATIHSAQKQSREKITERVVRALHHPYVDIFGHPTSRLIGEREPTALDLEAAFQVAKETGTIVEVDGAPERLDLADVQVRRALELGLKIVIDSDAHSPAGFVGLFYGVANARRGWATKKDVLNTLEWAQLKKRLKRNQT